MAGITFSGVGAVVSIVFAKTFTANNNASFDWGERPAVDQSVLTGEAKRWGGGGGGDWAVITLSAVSPIL